MAWTERGVFLGGSCLVGHGHSRAGPPPGLFSLGGNHQQDVSHSESCRGAGVAWKERGVFLGGLWLVGHGHSSAGHWSTTSTVLPRGGEIISFLDERL